MLLGDATYDPKDHLGTGVESQVPSLVVKTSYLWTASDPVYASVNGDDLLPDLAIGRLPAASVEEARRMVDKVVAYERDGPHLEAPVVLVTDDPDEGGDFVADAEEIASSLYGKLSPRKIYLSRLGTTATRDGVVEAFEQGFLESGYEGGFRRLADLLAARLEESGGIVAPGGLQGVTRLFVAKHYLYAGDTERAMDWLEKSFHSHRRATLGST